MRNVRLVAAALAAALAAFGCGSGSTGGGPSSSQLPALSKKVSVTFWHGVSGPIEAQLKAETDQFNSSQNLVTVNLVNKGNYNDMRTAILASLAAGSPPDMSQCYENHALKYSQSGALADLQPYMDAKDGLSDADKKDIFPALMKDGQLKGKQYMFPFNKSTNVLYYNADLFQQKGIQPPTTWDDFFKDAQLLTDSSAGRVGSNSAPIDVWYSMLYAYGGQVYDNPAKPAKSQINSSVAQQVTQKWADAVKAGTVKVYSGPNFPDQTAFQNGQTGMYLSTQVSYQYLKAKFKVGEAPLPGGPKGVLDTLFGTNVCVFSKAPQDVQHGAMLYIKYFTGTDATSAWAQKTSYMPVRASANNSLKDFYAANPTQQVGIGMLLKNQLFAAPATATGDDERATTSTELDNAISGRKDVKTALDSAASKINDLLATG